MICHLVWNVNGWVVDIEVLIEGVHVQLLPLVFQLFDSIAILILRVLLLRILLSFLVLGSLVLLSHMNKLS